MLRPGLLIVCALAAVIATGGAQAQIFVDPCSAIDEAVSTPGSISDELLADDSATECLVGALSRLAGTITFPDPPLDQRDTLNRTVAALNRQIEIGDISAINDIRRFDNTSIASMLAYGAASDDRPTRLNSALLLANIVDNSTVCVVMDHLANPALSADSDVARNGRINLLSIVSVVAPWASKSNYDNMQRLIPYLRSQLMNEKDATRTLGVLDTFDMRLKFQDQVASPNRTEEDDLESCRGWRPIWGDNAAFHIEYGAPQQ